MKASWSANMIFTTNSLRQIETNNLNCKFSLDFRAKIKLFQFLKNLQIYFL